MIFIFLLSILSLAQFVQPVPYHFITPDNMETLIKTNCYAIYSPLIALRNEIFIPEGSPMYKLSLNNITTFCHQVYIRFVNSFRGKKDNQILPADFKELMYYMAPNFYSGSDTLFYSGKTSDYISILSLAAGRRVAEEYIFGIVRGFFFCSSANSRVFAPYCNFSSNYDPKTRAYDSSFQNFFVALSVRFAQLQKGHITVALHPHRGPALYNLSHFYNDELPSFTNAVEKMTVWLLTNSTHFPKERCGDGSLVELQKIAESRNIVFECFENVPLQVYSFCVLEPDHPKCSSFDRLSLRMNRKLMKSPAGSSFHYNSVDSLKKYIKN